MRHQCPWCNHQPFERETSVIRHAARRHRRTRIEYDLLVKHNGVHPLCQCGCGEQVEYSQHFAGFNRFVHLHQLNVPAIVDQMKELGTIAAKDPVKRKKNSDRITALWQEPDYHDKQMEMRLDPNSSWRKKQKATRIAIAQTPEFKEKCAGPITKWWTTPAGDAMRAFMQTAEFSELVSVPTKKALSDPSIRELLSNHAIRMQQLGIIGPNMTVRQWKHNPFTGNDEMMHSTWEASFLDRCIELNYPVTKNHNVRIPYIQVDASSHQYVPDFQDTYGNLYEVKGWHDDTSLTKAAFAEAWCLERSVSYTLLVTQKECQEWCPNALSVVPSLPLTDVVV